MAEGRMLKRNISESRRLALLKTDAARLLWTWIIPHLDSEGRFYASPDMIKGKIVPRLETFSIKNIPYYINDMDRVGLITVYEVDGEKILQFRKFDTFQKIKKDREAAPLPGPDQGQLLPTKSGLDQDEVESESRPPFPNLREVNLREVNLKSQPSETGLRLSSLLFEKIKSRNNGHKPPNLKAWAKDIDLMIVRDGRDPTEIEEVICWCQEDDFWKNNILSTGKLKKQYDQLVLKKNDFSAFDPKPGKDNVTEWLLEQQKTSPS